MKNIKLTEFVAAGVVLAGLAFAPGLRANTAIFIGGGNASQTLIYDRITNILTGGVTNYTVSPTNSTVRTFVGSITNQPGLGTVTIRTSLLGAVQGLQDLYGQVPETAADGGGTLSFAPTVTVSTTTPEQVGVSSATFFTPAPQTLVVPYAFIKKSSSSPNLASVTNLTARQAAYLEQAAGTLPSAFFGGSSANDAVYYVPRNTASAVRTEIDANINFTGSISAWTTNAQGQPIFDVNGGQSSGGNVKNVLNTPGFTNAIGTVAAQDIGTFTSLAYEGVPYSVTNVENGSYPLWFYETYYYQANGQPGAPSANQLIVINALLTAITSPTYQTTSTLFIGNFVPLGSLNVQRTVDGGPITSTLY